MLIRGIEFREAAQSPRSPTQDYAPEGGKTKRTFRCPGNTETDRFNAVAALVGYSWVHTDTVAGIGPGGGPLIRRCVKRITPHGYPAVPHAQVNLTGKPHMFCTDVNRVEGYGRPLGVDLLKRATYDWKIMEAVYNSLPYFIKEDAAVEAELGILSDGGGDLLPGVVALPDEGDALRRGWRFSRFITRTREFAPKTLTVRGGLPRFVDPDPTKAIAIPEGIGIPQWRIRVTYTWHNVPLAAIPEKPMYLLANNVNNQPFDFAPVGTLLYVSTKEKQLQGPLGDEFRLVDLEHQFIYAPNVDFDGVNYVPMGHNALPRIVNKKMRWVKISTDGVPGNSELNTHLVFPRGDLSRLFRPPQQGEEGP